ncbi:MAG: hypothetical protein ACI8UO_003958, partial [Verrucomicrobiales bacterium]
MIPEAPNQSHPRRGSLLILSLLPSLLFSAEDAEPNYDEHIKPI